MFVGKIGAIAKETTWLDDQVLAEATTLVDLVLNAFENFDFVVVHMRCEGVEPSSPVPQTSALPLS